MNCRVFICAFALVLPWSFALAQTRGEESTTTKIDWLRLQSEKMKIQDFSSGQGEVLSTYPLFLQTLYTDFLSWEPRVNLPGEGPDKQCRLSFSSADLKTEISEVSQFQKDKPACVFRDEAEKTNGLKRLLQSLSVKFDVSDTNHFRKVIFQFNTNDDKIMKVRGLIGLHDDQKARPFVILRLGVHGNVDEFLAERYIGKAAYEDFGFNILVLENLTSHGYLSQDNPITFGGIEEGLHTFEILQILKNKNLFVSSLVTDIHLIGISLGAHGVFVTTMLDEVNDNYIKSTTALCPMVNLKETMNYHSQTSLAEAAIDFWNRMRLRALPGKVKELTDTGLWRTMFDLKPRFMPAVLGFLESHQTRPAIKIRHDMNFPKGFLQHLETSKSFYELNTFWPFFEDNKTPVLIITTPNDPLVPLQLNTDLIVSKKQLGLFEKTQIVQLDRGVHCALPIDYQWSFILDLLRSQWN